MATITSAEAIKTMLKNGGRYESDPAPDTIWSYTGLNGQPLFACFYHGTYCDIYDSPYVLKPILLFADGEITEAGEALLNQS